MTKNLYKTPKNWLTLDVCEKLLEGFRNQLEKREPLPPFNTRYKGILGSVEQTYDGKYLNSTVLEAAASYFNQFIRGHSFKNGNKRLGVLYTHIFLLMNGVDFTLTSEEMYSLAIAIAEAGEKRHKPEETKQVCIKIFEKFTKDFSQLSE